MIEETVNKLELQKAAALMDRAIDIREHFEERFGEKVNYLVAIEDAEGSYYTSTNKSMDEWKFSDFIGDEGEFPNPDDECAEPSEKCPDLTKIMLDELSKVPHSKPIEVLFDEWRDVAERAAIAVARRAVSRYIATSDMNRARQEEVPPKPLGEDGCGKSCDPMVGCHEDCFVENGCGYDDCDCAEDTAVSISREDLRKLRKLALWWVKESLRS